MLRNATCDGVYRVRWDVDRDGDFADDEAFLFSRDAATLNLWDIGRTFRVPEVDRDRAMNLTVQVEVPCAAGGQPAGHFKYGTFRLHVYDFTPGPPDTWTPRQLEIMNVMSVQESMWFGHRMMGEFGGDHTSAGLWGQIAVRGRERWAGGMITAWIMALNGHKGAYPPGTLNWFDVPPNAEWIEANAQRWHADPYAETIARYLNGTLRADSRVVPIDAGFEDNTCGYDADRNPLRCNRVDGNAGDGLGAWIGDADNGPHAVNSEDPATYLMGVYLASSAILTRSFAGTPAQVGDASVVGRRYEWLVQGQVDLLAQQQIGQGYGNGGWYYHRYPGDNGAYADMSVTQWALIGLDAAEKAAGFAGVVVPNAVKYRSAINTFNNTRDLDGGARYRTDEARTCTSLMLTGGSLVGYRWVGAHTMARSNEVAFPGESPLTQAALVDDYNRAIAYTKQHWYSSTKVHCGGRQDRFWALGDYKCGDDVSVYNAGRCGSTYTMYSHQKGFRTGEPELRFDDRDWAREFATYYIRAQDRVLDEAHGRDASYANFGRIYDDFCADASITCSYMAPSMMSAMGGLVLTPTLFNPKPVAIGAVQPPQVVEGCLGGQAGRVVFTHGGSFHPGPDQSIVAWQWDVDARDGLWWETNADPDFETDGLQAFEHRYLQAGDYVATLRAVDNVGQTHTTTLAVRVAPGEPSPPSAAAGGPYGVEVGQPLQLQAQVADLNAPCGEPLAVAWDLDGDGQFDDALGATPQVPWATLEALALDQPHPVALRVTDQAGHVATAQTTLTVYPQAPIAAGHASPTPAACGQPITFDGGASRHPNPARAVAHYDWDLDGDGGFDGSGARFTRAYDRFGRYPVTLRVTDDLGRSHTAQLAVDVNQGNRAPVARLAQPEVDLLDGQDLVLDGRPSSDPDAPCGDAVDRYDWDLDGDGLFDDAFGAQPTVPWAQVSQLMAWPADPVTGLPAHAIRLRVTDGFGATATAALTVRIFRAHPLARVVQLPQPSPIRIDNGASSTTLDGRASRAAAPGVAIARYEWDLNDDGAFEVADAPVVQLEKVFAPIPLPPRTIPETFVRLRVTDSNGRTDVVRVQVAYDIPPSPPTADADPSDPPERGYHIVEGEGLVLDGRQSFDPDADAGDWIRSVQWDVGYAEAAGFVPDVSQEAPAPADQDRAARASLSWAALQAAGVGQPGTYVVRVRVEDTTGLTAWDDAPLVVHPRGPVARLTANPTPAACGAQVTFDGAASAHPHPGIDLVGYRWDFDGDGQPDAEGPSVQHALERFTFGAANPVSLTVTDSRGHRATALVDVPVTEGNRPPAPTAGGFRDAQSAVRGPYAIALGEGLLLDAAGSTDPDAACGDGIQRFEWDLGADGAVDGEGAQLQLTWAALTAAGVDAPGQYPVRLRATDRFGAHADSLATLHVVPGPRAHAAATPSRASCEQPVVFSAAQSAHFGPDGQGFELVGYAWDLDGDGQFDDAQGPELQRAVVATPGPDGVAAVHAAVRVTDAAGRTDVAPVQVQLDIANQPPAADAGGPYQTGPVGLGFADVVLDARRSVDPNAPCDGIQTYKWDTDGDGLYGADDVPPDLEGAVVRLNDPAWQVNTVAAVGLVVCDGFGACSAPAEAIVEIGALAPPSGEIVWPRAGADAPCLGAGRFDLVVDVADPAGDAVTVTARVAGVAVAQTQVDTPDDGSAAQVRLSVDPALAPEGRNAVEVQLVDGDGAITVLHAGGRLTFDRTAPQVSLGDGLGADVCYNPGGVPAPEVQVVDGLDAAPDVATQTQADGCGRTVRVTATDACGNVGVAERSYLLAEPATVTLDGVAEGALVAGADLTWAVEGPAGCVSDVSAIYTRDGVAAAPYPEGQPLNQPGRFAITVSVANCAGLTRQQIRSFTVNAPPVAVPITAGHPAADPGQPHAYVTLEGAPLQLDGRASRAPEPADALARYRWDRDGDGAPDVEGAQVPFDVSEDGVYAGTLWVTDGLGATSQAPFQVTVLDVDPVADAGGPYRVAQGALFQPDGRASQPGSAADPIREYVWDFGDGSDPVVGAGLTQPVHVYQADGVYTVTLTVRDEDSEVSIPARVTVDDVDPVVEVIHPPADPREVVPVTFRAEARPGAPSDPLTRYEWDLDGDGVADYAGPGLTEITHQFDRPGQHVVAVTVRDGDSAAVLAQAVEVRELSLAELLAWLDGRIEAHLGDPGLDPFARFQLTGLEPLRTRAAWGEAHAARGVTLLALRGLVTRLVAAQAAEAHFGYELWALARQLKRELTRRRQAILNDRDQPRGEHHPSMQLATDHLGALSDLFDDPGFRADVHARDRAGVANDLLFEALEAHYWLADTVDQCNAYDDFRLPALHDPLALRPVANGINQDALRPALLALRAELGAYAALPDAPAAAAVADAAGRLDDILALQGLLLGPNCEANERCITDREALDLALEGAQLVRDLEAAANQGAWVRQWQGCMVLALKFRIELSIQRVEFACGVHTPMAQRARQVQAVGLDLVADDRDAEALSYYAHRDRQCTLVEVYDGCLVGADPTNDPYDGPLDCLNE